MAWGPGQEMSVGYADHRGPPPNRQSNISAIRNITLEVVLQFQESDKDLEKRIEIILYKVNRLLDDRPSIGARLVRVECTSEDF